MDLLAERVLLCRLTPDRALADLDQATLFVADRGMLTLAPCCSLPSLFGACHEPPYKPGVPGLGSWPATKWWWGGALAYQPGVVRTMVHRGKVLYLSAATAVVVDPLCRDGLARRRFAVGTALAGGPPHRSQRAGLPHWAPAVGASVEARVGQGVQDSGGR